MSFFKKLLRNIRQHSDTAKKIVVVLVILLLFAVPPVFVNSIIGYLPLACVLVSLLLLWVYLRLQRRFLTFKEASQSRACCRGESVDFSLELSNKSFLFYPRVDVGFYVKDALGAVSQSTRAVVALEPFAKREFEFDIVLDHVGEYIIGLENVTIHDLLGLFSYSFETHSEYRLFVSPRIVDIYNMTVVNQIVSDNQKVTASIIVDGMDYAGVRDYVMGDPMRAVHWNLTARMRKLITRLYEIQLNPQSDIFLDFSSYPYDSETILYLLDALAEAGFSIAQYAYKNAIDCNIHFADRDTIYQRVAFDGSVDINDVTRRLPWPSTDIPSAELTNCMEKSDVARRQGTAIVISSHFSDELIAALLNAKFSGCSVLLIAVVPHGFSKEERIKVIKPLARLEGAGINCIEISSSDDLAGRDF